MRAQVVSSLGAAVVSDRTGEWTTARASTRDGVDRSSCATVPDQTAAAMHFHVLETVVGCAPHLVSTLDTLPYPTGQPTFDTCDHAVHAVMGSALAHWGTHAEIHVEVALAIELDRARERTGPGAVATWTHAGVEGALWSLKACDCTDGSLAQLFNGCC